MTIDEKRQRLDYILQVMRPLRQGYEVICASTPPSELLLQVAGVLSAVGNFANDDGAAFRAMMKDRGASHFVMTLAAVQAMDLGTATVARMIEDDLNGGARP